MALREGRHIVKGWVALGMGRRKLAEGLWCGAQMGGSWCEKNLAREL